MGNAPLPNTPRKDRRQTEEDRTDGPPRDREPTRCHLINLLFCFRSGIFLSINPFPVFPIKLSQSTTSFLEPHLSLLPTLFAITISSCQTLSVFTANSPSQIIINHVFTTHLRRGVQTQQQERFVHCCPRQGLQRLYLCRRASVSLISHPSTHPSSTGPPRLNQHLSFPHPISNLPHIGTS